MALGPFYVAQKLVEHSDLRGAVMLMRHGETDWNREGRVMGRNPIELNARGRSQVEAAARFAAELRPDVIVTSPLVRARQTADIMAAGLGGIKIVEEPAIAEVLYGRWEGMVYHELIADPYYAEYRQAPVEKATPGGESIPQVQARGVGAVMDALGRYPGDRVMFVSHGDIIRTVLCHFMGLELAYFHRLRIDNASISTIQVAGKFAELKFLNLLADPAQAFIAPFAVKSADENRKR
ncbi:MAG TPA: histidine phosphatase family protein [Candidatus Binataceae bacterium]|nr:histidine phosphatase family protein [Candidatus Binataceae bacterium]